MVPLAFWVLVAVAIVILLRRPGVFAPALAGAEVAARWPATPAGEDEELPQTDRAPAHWLVWTVALLAALRLTLFVALGA